MGGAPGTEPAGFTPSVAGTLALRCTRRIISNMLPRRLDSLDVLRAICALMVLTAHLFGETAGFHPGPLLGALASLGVEAVIGLFVLSGCVIALQPYPGPGFYLRARLLRILPIYYVSLAGCLALMLWAHEPFRTSELFGNLFFVQTLFWQPLRPLDFFFTSWSLNYELYYYLAFLVLLARPQLLLPFAALSLLTGIGLYALPHEGAHMLLLHPLSLWCLWLCGAWIARRIGHGAAPSLVTATWLLAIGFCLTRLPWSWAEAKFDFGRLLGVGICFAALVWALLDRERVRMSPAGSDAVPAPVDIAWPWRFALAGGLLAVLWWRSHSLLAVKEEITAVVVVVTLAPGAVATVCGRLLRPLLPFLRYVGGLSYALYLVHYPLLQAGDRMFSHVAPVLRIVAVATLSFGLAHLLEYRFQPWLRRRFASPAPRPA